MNVTDAEFHIQENPSSMAKLALQTRKIAGGRRRPKVVAGRQADVIDAEALLPCIFTLDIDGHLRTHDENMKTSEASSHASKPLLMSRITLTTICKMDNRASSLASKQLLMSRITLTTVCKMDNRASSKFATWASHQD